MVYYIGPPILNTAIFSVCSNTLSKYYTLEILCWIYCRVRIDINISNN